MAKRARRLTIEERATMRLVTDGGDVWDYGKAMILRKIERDFPDLIEIGAAQNAPKDGARAQPYFGAILTAAGRKAIA